MERNCHPKSVSFVFSVICYERIDDTCDSHISSLAYLLELLLHWSWYLEVDLLNIAINIFNNFFLIIR